MTGDLDASGFDNYFRAVHGYEPYPWQSRLTQQVLEGGGWPGVINLPTGTGKTAVLDTAIFAMAVSPKTSPRRIVFVVDRRIVVDQVYERARLIRDRISAATDGVLADVNRRLKELSDAEQPLGVAALRGGIPVDGEWPRRPEQPWVMVSTVDQFGSRLLFRGYGISQGMRPIHAGLAGNDCLVILDEVHLSRAFAATLRDASSDGAVPLIRSVNANRLPRRFEVIEMSATPQYEDGPWFELHADDLDRSPQLKRIAKAQKRATLVTISGNRPPHESVPKKVLELLDGELRDDERSVGVIVNRVRTARETHGMLRAAGLSAHLVTGRMRPLDRLAVLDEIGSCVDPDRESPLDERTVVVATQAIEVGADFSFDVLISEAAPIDSLFQRFGRLDRRGRLAAKGLGPARCWILGVASELNSRRPDPVYGDASWHAWQELQAAAVNGHVDVGPDADILTRSGTDARAPKAKAPLLLPTHVDAWSQTSPEPVADPPIAEFLHGKERHHEPDVSVVWRLDLAEDPLGRVPAPALELVPPGPAEFLSVPVAAFKSWVQGRVEVHVADVALVPPAEERDFRARALPVSDHRLNRVVKWRGRGEHRPKRLERLDEIEPGDLIVVPCAWGGLRGGTWDPSEPPGRGSNGTDDDQDLLPVSDLGDEAQLALAPLAASGEGAQLAYGSRATFRLDARLLDSLPIPPPQPEDEADADQPIDERVRTWLIGIDGEHLSEWMSKAVERFRRAASFEIHLLQPVDAPDYYVLRECKVDPACLDGFDDGPSITGTEIGLRDHLMGVGEKAFEYGKRLGLSEDICADLRLAGELHDLGKVDSRFQAQLHGHDPVRIAESEGAGEPLAKSLPDARPHPRKWPDVRHEFSSVALAQSNKAVLESAHDPDLVLHLVGTHHGFGRPLPGIRKDKQPERLDVTHDGASMSVYSDVAETSLALEMADRFWRLHECYGHHGLVWLEAILRLADIQRSVEEAK